MNRKTNKTKTNTTTTQTVDQDAELRAALDAATTPDTLEAAPAPKRGKRPAPVASAAPTAGTVQAVASLLSMVAGLIDAPPAQLIEYGGIISKRLRAMKGGILTATEKVGSCRLVALAVAALYRDDHSEQVADAARWLQEADASARAGKADADTLAVVGRLYHLAARTGVFRTLAEEPHYVTRLDSAGAIILPPGCREAVECGGILVALDKDGRDMRQTGPYGGKGATFAHLGERLTDRAASGEMLRSLARALGDLSEKPTAVDEPSAAE